MFNDLKKVAAILDEHIEKGLSLEKKSKVEVFEEQINKSLSHNPFNPHEMTYDSPYYNPYKFQAGEGYMPYDADHWAAMGKDPDDYLTTTKMYKEFDLLTTKFKKSFEELKGLSKAIQTDLSKAGVAMPAAGSGGRGLPLGTIHTYKDGQRYKKVAEGQWVPMAGLEDKSHAKFLTHTDPKVRTQANNQIEQHAQQEGGKIEKIGKLIQEKHKAQETKRDLLHTVYKQVAKTTSDKKQKEKMLKEAEKHSPEKSAMSKKLQDFKTSLSGKAHKVDFELQAGEMKTKHTSIVNAKSKDEAMQKVHDHLKKFPELSGHRITRIKASEVKAKAEAKAKTEAKVDVKAPEADKGKPDNKMGPPPPENAVFLKAGKDVTFDDAKKFVDAFSPTYHSLVNEIDPKVREMGAAAFSSRLKDEGSLLKKMNGRLSGRSMNTATDIIGARALATTIEDQAKIAEHFRKTYDIVEFDDSVSKPRADGYRAIHVLFRAKDGKIGEMQIKTLNQQVYSGFTHDHIYKGDAEIKNNPEVIKFTKDLSDYLYELDKGGKDDPNARPQEPEILKKNKIVFPWEDIERAKKDKAFALELAKKSMDIFKGEKSPIKWYVTIRDEHANNGKTLEFDSFKEAREFKRIMRKKGHKGELPVGHAHSLEEYLKVFSEYRPTTQHQLSFSDKKTGEGSRGGQVVGHTKSGKPIYKKKSGGKK